MFDERQIYRIDHYLGKETVQNILVLRFANSIFEPLFNQSYVDHVQITVAEEEGVGTRAGYYEQAGALRDMVQNHIAAAARARRRWSRRIRSTPTWSATRSSRCSSRCGRSQAPAVDDSGRARAVRRRLRHGHAGAGYREEAGVKPRIAHRDLRRAAGVHRQLALGRRAVLPAHRQTPAEARQRNLGAPEGRAADSVQREPGRAQLDPNVLSIRIQPDEGFALGISSKVPGPRVRIYPVQMDFHYGSTFGGRSPEAYERLLLDVMAGDPTLFMRRDAVEAAWQWVMPILNRWSEQTTGPMPTYPAGEWGRRSGPPDRSDGSTMAESLYRTRVADVNAGRDRAGSGPALARRRTTEAASRAR